MPILSIVAACMFVPMSDYKLIWSDEFDRPGKPDPKKWKIETGYAHNNEKQYYTNREKNIRVEGGKLIIEAHKDSFEGKHEITSGRMNTQGLASWKYGKFEARAKVPTGRGTWPAFWMLGDNIGEVGWPACGEIDILEHVGYDPDRVHFNVHTKDYNHVMKTNKGTNVELKDPHKDFHVYSAEWTDTQIDFFVDGKKTFTFKKESDDSGVWPFSKPEFIILNLAIGGDWGGSKGIDDAIFPARYEVDYVRVYQK